MITILPSVHEGKKPFKCDKCEVYFGLKYDLNLHIASVHEGKKPFKCEICNDQFELKHELNEHIASVYEEENQSAHNDCMIMCHSCEKPATHFCKSCDQYFCKFCIIEYYRNTIFSKNHDMIPPLISFLTYLANKEKSCKITKNFEKKRVKSEKFLSTC